jgi:hypothetical protein
LSIFSRTKTPAGTPLYCTECNTQAPLSVELWGEKEKEKLRRKGWFVWATGAAPPYEGIALCLRCRRQPTAHDMDRNLHPTADLETLAEKGVSP